MINKQSSYVTAPETVAVPELCFLLEDPEYISNLLSDAFSFADSDKYKNLLQMKRLLSCLFGGNIKAPSVSEEFISVPERTYETLNNRPTDGLSFVFPALISSKIPADCSVINRLTTLGNSATVNAECEDVILLITKAPQINWREITIRCNSVNAKSLAWVVPALNDRGVSVSLYNSHADNKNCVFYNGIAAVPGKSLIRILPKLKITANDGESYSIIKEEINAILSEETDKRFRFSTKHNPYHKHNPKAEELVPLGLFYPDSFTDKSKKHIPGILEGGASDELAVITPEFSKIPRDSESFKYTMRCVTTACRSLRRHFPFTPVAYYKDTALVHDHNMIIDAVRSHIQTFVGLNGNFSLEIIPDNDFGSLDTAVVSSVITAFFTHGGSLITFKPKGNIK